VKPHLKTPRKSGKTADVRKEEEVTNYSNPLSLSFPQLGSITTPELFKKRRLSAAKSFEQSQSQQEKRDARNKPGVH
jgi:hypothetical protein